MPINALWILHHQEQVEAARAEFDHIWEVEKNRMLAQGASASHATAQYIREWHKFLSIRLPERYPGDLP